ncbi:MAG: hypothetical protein ACR2FN_09760 [Chitinophagaceae bacterium]
MKKIIIVFYAVCLFIVSCTTKHETSVKPDILASNIDSTINPADDFFDYANGGWIKNNPIPEAESGWGIGNLVEEEIYDRKKTINEKALAANAANGTVTQKIGDFWYSGIDTTNIEKQGLKPLQPEINEINNIKSINDLINVTADFHNKKINVLFDDYAAQDDKNSEMIVYHLGQGGLGMPDRDYYFKTDASTVNVRKAYQNFLVRTLQQLSINNNSILNDSAAISKEAQSVYALETNLAKASRKIEDLRDPYHNYNKMTVPQLQKLMPDFIWSIYLTRIGINKLDSAIVGQPEFFSALNKELKTNFDVWKNYLKVHLILEAAPYLDSETYSNYFNYRKSLTGVSEPRPRWKRVLQCPECVMKIWMMHLCTDMPQLQQLVMKSHMVLMTREDCMMKREI